MTGGGHRQGDADNTSPAALLRRFGLSAKKSWGQCFLHDPSVVARIVKHAGVGPDDTVVEIGGGLGVLSLALARAAGRLVVVEKDRDMVAVLRQRLADHPGASVLGENALKLSLDELRGHGPSLPVVGNLPYNIAGPLLFHLLDQRRHLRSLTIMVQREMARRLVAPPGNRTYGAPSVICQVLCRVRPCFDVGRGAFFPAPRVDSAVVRLDPMPDAAPPARLSEVVHAGFSQRRKTLRKSLGARFGKQAAAEALEAANIDGGRRPETLSPEEFVTLATVFSA